MKNNVTHKSQTSTAARENAPTVQRFFQTKLIRVVALDADALARWQPGDAFESLEDLARWVEVEIESERRADVLKPIFEACNLALQEQWKEFGGHLPSVLVLACGTLFEFISRTPQEIEEAEAKKKTVGGIPILSYVAGGSDTAS
jgi:hypothetical protein